MFFFLSLSNYQPAIFINGLILNMLTPAWIKIGENEDVSDNNRKRKTDK